MEMKQAVKILDQNIQDPKIGLPDEVFYFISRNIPLTNVDLLIKDETGRTLLAWRDDVYSGTGWHIPGGIIRFREKFETRIQKVALSEIGCEVKYKTEPIALNEIFNTDMNDRGHFISILYECFLSSDIILNEDGKKENEVGYLKWHEKCPDNLIKYHDIYREFI